MKRHTRLEPSKTLSIKVPVSVSARIARLARARRTTVSAVVREALEQLERDEAPTFGRAARRWIGRVSGGPGDLATNPKHLQGLGR